MSQILHIHQGQKTPELLFVPAEGLLVIRGKSIPENPREFYQAIYEMLPAYAENPAAQTKITIQLEYYNTSSAKCLVDLLKFLEGLHLKGKTSMLVRWEYKQEDSDMAESGEDFQMIISAPFEIVKVEG